MATLAALAAPYLCAALMAMAARAAGTPPNSGAVNRTVTPNHDHKNDTFIFRCYNPKDYQITAYVYGPRGERLASMRRTKEAYPYTYMEWDPDTGCKAPGGVYIYEVTVNDKTFTGTVVVIR